MVTQAYDLNKLAKILSEDRRYTNQVRIIEDFSSACSILQDLFSARGSLETLAAIQLDTDARIAFGQALMMHAVITYSRALISRTNNRRQIDVEGKGFSREQRIKHRAIASLRSTALAHYHKPLGPYAAEWIDDKAVVIIRDGEVDMPKDVYSRSNFTKVALEALGELIDAAIDYVNPERDRRAVETQKVLLAMKSDEFTQASLAKCVFDPAAYFRDERAAEHFWRQGAVFGLETFIPKS